MERAVTPEQRRALAAHAGLCARCLHLRPLSNGRSVFVFCRMSEEDPRYPRYPPLPVARCAGFAPVD